MSFGEKRAQAKQQTRGKQASELGARGRGKAWTRQGGRQGSR